jgi:UDP-glucose 6-dehydrogenase
MYVYILALLLTSDHNIVLWKSRTYASVAKAGNIVRVKVRDVNHTNMEQFGSFLENYDCNLVPRLFAITGVQFSPTKDSMRKLMLFFILLK